jgi:E3 ubiquitin-protein ligase HUWE1
MTTLLLSVDKSIGESNTWVFQRFFSKVFEKELGLFEKSLSGTHYLPSTGANLELLQGFGKLLARVLLVEQTIDLHLAPSVWKYPCNLVQLSLLGRFFLGIRPTLRDLEVYDPLLFHSLQRIIVLPNVTQLAVTFEGLIHNGDQIPVTEQNKHQFVELTIQQILLESRRAELEAMKQGFYFIPQVAQLYAALSPSDIQILLSKNDYISPQMVTSLLQFRDFPAHSKVKYLW